jgi:hypothetical protein
VREEHCKPAPADPKKRRCAPSTHIAQGFG